MCRLLRLLALAGTAGAARVGIDPDSDGLIDDASFARAASAVQIGLRGCDQMSPEMAEVPEDEVEVIYIRHGISLNNVFKECGVSNAYAMSTRLMGAKLSSSTDFNFDPQSECRFQAGYEKVCHEQNLCGPYDDVDSQSNLAWEIGRQSQDCMLHPDAELQTIALGQALADIFPKEVPVKGFYTSPLRRTVQTALGIATKLFPKLSKEHFPAVGLSPWAHERYKSMSDWAQDGESTAVMTKKYTKHLGDKLSVAGKLVSSQLQIDLTTLADWADKTGDIFPELEVLPKEDDIDEGPDIIDKKLEQLTSLKFYPTEPGAMFSTEPEPMFEVRMTILRRWLKKLAPGGRYILVSHGEIGKALFDPWRGGKEFANLAVVAARYKPATADERTSAAFFHDVQMGQEKWKCPALPLWKEE